MNDITLECKKQVDKEWDSHWESAKEALEYVENSTAKYRGETISTLYMAKLFPSDVVEKLRRESQIIYGILVKVTKEFMENAEYRKLFGFPKKLETLMIKNPGYSNLIPMARLDIFLNEEDYSYKFCEFNTDGTSAMNEDRELNHAFQITKEYKQLLEKYDLQTFELFDSWVKEVKKLYGEWAEDRKEKIEEVPAVAIVDFLEKGSSIYEFEQFQKSFERAGFRSYICEIRELSYDGKRLYTKEGKPIDAVYRRAVTSDIFEHLEETEAFVRAVEDGNVCTIGNFCTQAAHDKTIFYLLHDDRTKQFLTEEENHYIREHIPVTAELNREQIKRNYVYQNKDRWLIKPKNHYGAYGVYAGIHFTKRKWKKIVRKCRKKNYILQEFIMPYKSYNIDFALEKPEFKKYTNMTGIYMYGGKMAGLYSRMSSREIISGVYGENVIPTIMISPK
ncbi:MAG: glutathionylspermidine synthase family protein [Lachnoclostridium sp.]|jgi:hypothetical protein|nr:glutathionylspermidine synthase family protein [Lachnoclostridium sp.]